MKFDDPEEMGAVDPNVRNALSEYLQQEQQQPRSPRVLTLKGVHMTPAELRFLAHGINHLAHHQQPLMIEFHSPVSFSKDLKDRDGSSTSSSPLLTSFFLEQQPNLQTVSLLGMMMTPSLRLENEVDEFVPILESLRRQPQEQGPHFSQLKTLKMVGMRVHGYEMGRLVGSMSTPAIELLRCPFDMESVHGLSSTMTMTPRHLTLSGCNLTNRMVSELSQNSACWQPNALSALNLSWNMLSPAALTDLAHLLAGQRQSLCKLHLTIDFSLSFDSSFWQTPFHLALAGLPLLENLSFRGSRMNASVIPALVSLGPLPNLKTLDLGGVGLFSSSSAGDVRLVQAFVAWVASLPNLTELQLWKCGVNNAIVNALFGALAAPAASSTTTTSSPRLQVLGLGNNHFSVCGWEQSLPRLSHLVSLSMTGLTSNHGTTWPALERALIANISLTSFAMNGTHDQWNQIDQIMVRNRGIQAAARCIANEMEDIRNHESTWPGTLKYLLKQVRPCPWYHRNNHSSNSSNNSNHSRGQAINENVSAAFLFFRGAAAEGIHWGSSPHHIF